MSEKSNCEICGKPTKKLWNCGCNPGLSHKTAYRMLCQCGVYCSDRCLNKTHKTIENAFRAQEEWKTKMMASLPKPKCTTCGGTGKIKGYRCCSCNGSGLRD